MIQIQEHVILAPYTTFGIGGAADNFVIVKTREELLESVAWAKEKKIPFFILGCGANILIGDKGFRGLVIKNEAKNVVISNEVRPFREGSPLVGRNPVGISQNDILRDDKFVYLTAEAGVTIGKLIDLTVQKGLSGLEHFAGIPSTVGGAIWQNLHFLGSDRKTTVYIGDILLEATLYTQEGEIKKVTKEYFHFGYDESILHERKDIVLDATFSLIPEDPEVIQKRLEENLLWRQSKHPYEAWKVSAGSIFRKLKGYGAGRLIQEVGLKGHTIGGAMISDKHANFIVNTGGASAKDVRDLIALVQRKVKEKLGLELVPEISFVGEF